MAAEEAIEAIHRAAREGDTVNVARMLDEDPRLLSSTRGNDDDTLLHTASYYGGHVDLVRLLLDRGAEINQANANEDTALHLAAEMGDEEMVSTLLTRGADPSIIGDWGQTVIMLASEGGHMAVVRLLLRSMGGGGLDERTEFGVTALSFACYRGHADVVRALLLAGADHTIADHDARTPLQVAQGREHHECVGVIQVSTSLRFTRPS
jgi:ankyrin repeat protein